MSATRTAAKWRSFPRAWVRESLWTFGGGANAGVHMAALRVYLGLALVTDFKTRTACASWTQLEALTGLSRPSVGKGIERAVDGQLIEIEAVGQRHTYRQLGKPSTADGVVPFAKVPAARLTQALPALPVRGRHALNCLKIYIALATIRPRTSNAVSVSHKTLIEWTGVHARDVRAALDVLFNHRLLHWGRSEALAANGHPYNVYWMLGFDRSEILADADLQAPAESQGLAASSESYVDLL